MGVCNSVYRYSGHKWRIATSDEIEAKQFYKGIYFNLTNV